MDNKELVTTERVALLTWGLMLGATYTTSQAANLTGLTRDSAYRMLRRLSCVLPIYCDGGQWRVLNK